MPEIKKIQNNEQKIVIISLIVSDVFCREIIPVLKINKELTFQTFSNYYRVVLNWILEYYEKYKVSPKKDIQKIYESNRDNMDEEDAEFLEDFLENLNDKYEREENYNEQYVIDQSLLFLRKKNLEILEKKISSARKNGEIDEAEKLLNNFREIKNKTEIYKVTDIFEDMDVMSNCYKIEEERLFKLPGVLGDKLGYFVRGDFIAIIAPAKRGKSWWLSELAYQGLSWNLRVALINLEMAHTKCEQRFCQNFLGEIRRVENTEKGYDIIDVPYFQKEDNGKYTVKYRKKEKIGLNDKEIRKKLKSMKKLNKKGGLKIISFPAGTLTVNKLEEVCDDLLLDGFPVDVIVVDYADIILSEKKQEHRHQIDGKWQGLRSLAQKKHCLVATGSHSNKSTFTKDIAQNDLSEDYRKLNHVTMGLGLNQKAEEIDLGLMRVNVVAHRDRRFNPEAFILVLQNLEIGKCYLDSKYLKNVNYKEILKGEIDED